MDAVYEDVPQGSRVEPETEALKEVRKMISIRTRLEAAGFATCTSSGMLCFHALGVGAKGGETTVECLKARGDVYREQAAKCLFPRLTQLPILDGVPE